MSLEITTKKKGLPKQHVLTVRVTEELQQKIRQNAELSNRTITEELTLRLEQSLNRNASRTASFLNLIKAKIDDIELQTGQSWLEDQRTWQLLGEWLTAEMQARKPTPRS